MLLRALRDFNLGKLTADDTSIFMGLLSDLFPRTLDQVPRAIDLSFESKVSSAACNKVCSKRQRCRARSGMGGVTLLTLLV